MYGHQWGGREKKWCNRNCSLKMLKIWTMLRGGGKWDFSDEHSWTWTKREHWTNCCKDNCSLNSRFASRTRTVNTYTVWQAAHQWGGGGKKGCNKNCSVKMLKIRTILQGGGGGGFLRWTYEPGEKGSIGATAAKETFQLPCGLQVGAKLYWKKWISQHQLGLTRITRNT